MVLSTFEAKKKKYKNAHQRLGRREQHQIQASLDSDAHQSIWLLKDIKAFPIPLFLAFTQRNPHSPLHIDSLMFL